MSRLILQALGASATLAMLLLLSGCGHTIYGAGKDMERIGRKLQGQSSETQAPGYPAPNYPPPNTYSPNNPYPGTYNY